MNEYALIVCRSVNDQLVYGVIWFQTLKEIMEARRTLLDESTDIVAWVAYCPPALLAHGETLLPIRIPGVPQ